MNDKRNEWTEAESQLYQQIAPVAVPARAEQMATLLALIPFSREDAFRAVELSCGEGLYSYALLDAFPNASVLALDGSPDMLKKTGQHFEGFGGRGKVQAFELLEDDWLGGLDRADCVFSSLSVHHLDDEGKQRLFKVVCEKLSPRGVFLIADLIRPQRPEALKLFADTWDYVTEVQSISKTGSGELFEKFVEMKWNHYRHPDAYDTPSPLFDQLVWMKEAGFVVADCFWMQAAHAIYGGYKSKEGAPESGLSFDVAMHYAHRALGKAAGLDE